MFAVLRARAREALVVGEDENLDALAGGALRFGFGPRADIRGQAVELGRSGSRFQVEQVRFSLPVPGRHNVANALAAIAACRALDVPLADMVAPLGSFQGVGRRFQTVGRARGVTVVDDFAHNADKITAALATAKLNAPRVLADLPAAWLWADALPAQGLRRHLLSRAPQRRPPMDARSVLCRRHGVPRLLRRRHRERDCRARARRPSSRRLAPGSRLALPKRRKPATSSSSWARAIPRSPISLAKLWQSSADLPQNPSKTKCHYAQKLSYDCSSTRGCEAAEAGCRQLREEWGLRQSTSNPLPLSAKQVSTVKNSATCACIVHED